MWKSDLPDLLPSMAEIKACVLSLELAFTGAGGRITDDMKGEYFVSVLVLIPNRQCLPFNLEIIVIQTVLENPPHI